MRDSLAPSMEDFELPKAAIFDLVRSLVIRISWLLQDESFRPLDRSGRLTQGKDSK
jgi:hypothetical protein